MIGRIAIPRAALVPLAAVTEYLKESVRTVFGCKVTDPRQSQHLELPRSSDREVVKLTILFNGPTDPE